MKILVQKFGGTSVSTHERRKMSIEKILAAINNGYLPVVVVSAMGRKGEPYATDSLLMLLDSTFKNNNKLATDLMMSCGEVISTVVMCNDLFASGIPCIPLTGGQAGIITDNNYGSADTTKIKTDRILEILSKNQVPIIAGFQGESEEGFVTTLGRGGSDVTASLLGAALKAEEIQIYTDVNGIMTADPKIVSDAFLINEINYNEVFQFSDQGAKVIHPRAVEIAMKANIPLVIKNTLNNCKGTIINNMAAGNKNTLITGITHMNNRVQIKVTKADNVNNEYYNEFLNDLAKNLISIDLINVFTDEKIFTIDSEDYNKFECIMQKLNLRYTHIDQCSKIAVIGSGMRGVPGIMARILNALNTENIEVIQTADSHTTIWCLVESKNTVKAIKVLHKEFMSI